MISDLLKHNKLLEVDKGVDVGVEQTGDVYWGEKGEYDVTGDSTSPPGVQTGADLPGVPGDPGVAGEGQEREAPRGVRRIKSFQHGTPTFKHMESI